MHNVSLGIADQFAEIFAGRNQGLTAPEMTAFFRNYSQNVRNIEYYGFVPPRRKLFIELLYSLPPNEQYYALTDLCNNPPASKKKAYTLPPSNELAKLKAALYNEGFVKPVGICISRLNHKAIRDVWLEANSRLAHNPASAITAARTLLETTCSTIISERGETPDSSGDLDRLYKQCRKCLGLEVGGHAAQAVHTILKGLTSVVSGVAGLSNAAGDRHGLPHGIRIDDPLIASTAVNSAGTICLFLVDVHMFTKLAGTS
jgi:hypothetical protein